MVKGFGVVRQIQRDIHNVHLQYYHNGLKIREMGGLDGHAFWNIIIYYYHVPLLSPSLPPAQFEAGDCSLGREGGSTPCRQQLQQLQQQQPQHTLRQKTWNHKSLVSTSLSSPSSPSSPSFPSSPILILSPLHQASERGLRPWARGMGPSEAGEGRRNHDKRSSCTQVMRVSDERVAAKGDSTVLKQTMADTLKPKSQDSV